MENAKMGFAICDLDTNQQKKCHLCDLDTNPIFDFLMRHEQHRYFTVHALS